MSHRSRNGSVAARGRSDVAFLGFFSSMLLLAALSACASMKQHTDANFERGSASADKFRTDSRACEKQAEAHGKEHGYGPYDPTHGAYNRMFDACMRSSGYQMKPTPE